MFCVYCGRRISDNAVFCPECGKKLQTNGNEMTNVSEQPNDELSFKEAAAAATKKSVSYVNSEVHAASSEVISQAGSYVGDLKNAFMEERAKMKGMFRDSLKMFKSGGSNNKPGK